MPEPEMNFGHHPAVRRQWTEGFKIKVDGPIRRFIEHVDPATMWVTVLRSGAR